ncbi:MAG: hypothetical protein AAF609_05350 [Cyanobacteria bacterium P01_C01_bin.120]
MPLTADQLTAAKATLKERLEAPLKSEGVRLNLSPATMGALSKGEFQIFQEGSNSTTPQQLTYNAAYRQFRTIRFRCFASLKDLRDPWAVLPVLEAAKDAVVGIQLFGSHPEADYEGGLYASADQFTQDRDDASRWIYQLNLQCQLEEYLDVPSIP